MPAAESSQDESYFNTQHQFFLDKYRKLKKLPFYFYTEWYPCGDPRDQPKPYQAPNAAIDSCVKALLSPILMPLTAVTVSATIVLGIALGLCHLLASMVSTVLDQPVALTAFGVPCIPTPPVY